LVDCCLYGGFSALMTITDGTGVSHLLDTGHNTGSTKLGLGCEWLWLLLWWGLRQLWRLRRQRHDAKQGGAGGVIARMV